MFKITNVTRDTATKCVSTLWIGPYAKDLIVNRKVSKMVLFLHTISVYEVKIVSGFISKSLY